MSPGEVPMARHDYETEDNARMLREATKIKLNPAKLKKAFAQLKTDAEVANKTVVDVKKLFKSK